MLLRDAELKNGWGSRAIIGTAALRSIRWRALCVVLCSCTMRGMISPACS